ncbi:MAG: hypothetical protein H7829_18025 [Magnetococcus sp. THC-1_WYH]
MSGPALRLLDLSVRGMLVLPHFRTVVRIQYHRNANEDGAKRRWHAEGGKPKHEDEDD